MNLEDIFVPATTGFFGALVAWVFGRKKENVEVQGTEINNTQEAIKIWREMAQEMTDKVKELSDKVDNLKEEISQLKAENVQLRSKLDENYQDKPKRTKPDKAVRGV